MHRRFRDFEAMIDKLKMEMTKAFGNVQEQLNSKASTDALNDLETSLLDKMNELFQALVSKFADKNEMKKILKHLEQQLKNLYDVVMNLQPSGRGNEEDAMFSKKPLGGFSCASCDKNIVNL